MASLSWSVSGRPVSQQRARFATRTGHVYDPSSLQKHAFLKASIEACPLPDEPLEGPLKIVLKFTFKHVKKRRPHHTSRPDVDNLVKFVLDSLQSPSGYFNDDAQITTLEASKEYGDEPSTFVHITAI